MQTGVGQDSAPVFPAASAEFNRRYALWYDAREQTPPPQLVYCPRIDVIAQEGVAEDVLLSQRYKNAARIGEEDESGGEYVCYLFKGDTLAPDALLHLVSALQDPSSRPDFVYADEDICVKGTHGDPHFKTSLNKVELLCRNCVGRPLLVRRELHEAAGRLIRWDEGVYYGYVLRCARRALHPVHIAQVLLSRDRLPRMKDSEGRAAIDAFLQAEGQKAYAVGGACKNTFHVRLASLKNENVGVIVPNKNGLTALQRLLESVERNALYPHYKLFIVDYGTQELETLRYYELLRANRAAQILHMEKDNFAALWNYGAMLSRCPYLLFLKPGTCIETPGFLVPLMELCSRPGIGAVGSRSVDESGAPLSEPMLPRDLLENLPWLLHAERAVSMLRGDCLMLRAEVFFGAGCFDETMGSSGAAAELCIRLMRRNRCNVLAAGVLASVETAAQSVSPKEKERLYDTLRPFSKGDPYCSAFWKEVWSFV